MILVKLLPPAPAAVACCWHTIASCLSPRGAPSQRHQSPTSQRLPARPLSISFLQAKRFNALRFLLDSLAASHALCRVPHPPLYPTNYLSFSVHVTAIHPTKHQRTHMRTCQRIVLSLVAQHPSVAAHQSIHPSTCHSAFITLHPLVRSLRILLRNTLPSSAAYHTLHGFVSNLPTCQEQNLHVSIVRCHRNIVTGP